MGLISQPQVLGNPERLSHGRLAVEDEVIVIAMNRKSGLLQSAPQIRKNLRAPSEGLIGPDLGSCLPEGHHIVPAACLAEHRHKHFLAYQLPSHPMTLKIAHFSLPKDDSCIEQRGHSLVPLL